MNRTFILFLLSAICLMMAAQHDMRFRIMEYNCENLFDTIHDEGKNDLAFTPDGENQWNTLRYFKKQSSLARVILEAGGLRPVDLIGLCEVENDSVIADLTHRTRLAHLDYKYVMTDCADTRGIDVALLYQPYTFRLVGSKTFSVPYNVEKERPTRDVLLCSGIVLTGDTLDVMVVHFPSRRGGAKLTEGYRMRVADVVLQVKDSLFAVRQNPSVIVMGDCNDEPDDRSLCTLQLAGFVNLSASAKPVDGKGERRMSSFIQGTYFYQREWSRIDNILVSQDAVHRFKVGEAVIFAPDYLLECNAAGFLVPYRLYRGPSYHGGVSDHLPLVLDMWF